MVMHINGQVAFDGGWGRLIKRGIGAGFHAHGPKAVFSIVINQID
jgi:hypothetical protein